MDIILVDAQSDGMMTLEMSALASNLLPPWLASVEAHQLDMSTRWCNLRTESRQGFSINNSPNY